ncbi:MAG: ACP S-malonyltransferase [Gammaproteobacteria bacterium]|jgi:[acyl-carrier-protein] S-malonyltransferase|nr:ACP S-malonyltransferase [Gammaproteobacteria bacterium]
MSIPIAAVFPGQGSQSIGMLAELGAAHATVRQTFDEASATLGYDLWTLVQEGPVEDLNRTDRTQPAMLAADVAVWRVWREQGGAMPALMAGHSLGEYAALVCAGALDFGRAVTLVAERGRFMQEAVPAGQGAMAAVLGLDDERVREVCAAAAAGEVIAAVNFNSPGQVVIAGHATAVERAIGLAKEAGAKRALPLPVSVPSHCALMKPAAERMAALLEETTFAAPAVPVLHNADVRSYSEGAAIRNALVRQLYSPVRWVETVQDMVARGTRTMIEFGPGKVLSGLGKRIDRELVAFCVQDTASLEEALTAQHGAV